MCGIIARIGSGNATEKLVTGLQNLEYRGYDSAGIAIQNGTGPTVVKREGEIDDLRSALSNDVPKGYIGIGHTRWSTHGAPTDDNAHPHTDCTGDVAVVHNGIIENYDSLRADLETRGHEFTSDTDSEVIPHLIEERRADGATTEEAFRATVAELEGSYAIAVIVEDNDAIFATRHGSPLVLGVGDGEYYLASDVPAFLEYTEDVIYLEDGDVATVTPSGLDVTDLSGDAVDRPVQTVDWDAEDAAKDDYDHYMVKEIHEQPSAVARTLQSRIDPETGSVHLEDFPAGTFEDVEQVQFVACGTSYHAAMYGAQLLSDAGIPAYTFRASEYVSSPAPATEDTLVVAVTQSGETADTLGALRQAQSLGARTIAVTNVLGSTAAREADDALFIRAGPEIGVAATKTYSSQATTLTLLGERIVRDAAGEPAADDPEEFLNALALLPEHVEHVLTTSDAERLAEEFMGSDSYFFIGRGLGFSVALEGALKFKEITYEHAEGFAAGELKHGPLALVTPDTPVFAVLTGQEDTKTLQNAKEVQARGAPVVAVTSEAGDLGEFADVTLSIPDTHPAVAGLLANVQLQLLSYHVANMLGRSIDKPRNLAKSVTVE